jgi:hypothetical protein
MTVTIRVPRLRSLGLVAAGIIAGATLVAPVAARVAGADNVVPATTYTRSVSCAGLSFYPASSTLHYSNEGALRVSGDDTIQTGGAATFRCDPGLPNGANVTKVQFTLANAQNVPGVQGCNLTRVALAATGNGAYQVMASVPSAPALTPIVRETTTSISHPAVNDSAYAYWLECTIEYPISGTGIYGADVIYTISAANG